MTEQLRRMVVQVELLPEAEQNAIAAIIERELLDKKQWDALFDDPRSDRALDDLAAEALAEAKHGETRPLEELLCN